MMELALVNDSQGWSFWAVIDSDGQEVFAANDYWNALDKYEELLTEQEEMENNK